MMLPLLVPLLLTQAPAAKPPAAKTPAALQRPAGIPADCTVLASRKLTGAAVPFEQYLARCPNVADPESKIPMLEFWLCAKGACTDDLCGHMPGGDPNTPDLKDYGDISFAIPSADRSGLLVLMRDGQGNYPTLGWFSVQKGQPVCTEVEGEGQVMKRAGRFLKPGESFGFRGGNMSVQDGLAFWTRGIYAKDDPNCCPSRGFLQITAKLGATLQFLSAKRLPPDAFDEKETDEE